MLSAWLELGRRRWLLVWPGTWRTSRSGFTSKDADIQGRSFLFFFGIRVHPLRVIHQGRHPLLLLTDWAGHPPSLLLIDRVGYPIDLDAM